jgi:hypothetical protein
MVLHVRQIHDCTVYYYQIEMTTPETRLIIARILKSRPSHSVSPDPAREPERSEPPMPTPCGVYSA